MPPRRRPTSSNPCAPHDVDHRRRLVREHAERVATQPQPDVGRTEHEPRENVSRRIREDDHRAGVAGGRPEQALVVRVAADDAVEDDDVRLGRLLGDEVAVAALDPPGDARLAPRARSQPRRSRARARRRRRARRPPSAARSESRRSRPRARGPSSPLRRSAPIDVDDPPGRLGRARFAGSAQRREQPVWPRRTRRIPRRSSSRRWHDCKSNPYPGGVTRVSVALCLLVGALVLGGCSGQRKVAAPAGGTSGSPKSMPGAEVFYRARLRRLPHARSCGLDRARSARASTR